MRSIAIIPARGGSRRLPGKNIRVFEGQPILGYAIAAARASGVFDELMTSTDSPEIAAVARSLGCDVPFMRSARTADDHAGTTDVVLEVLETYRAQGQEFDLGCCIYPCNPFLTGEKLRRGRELLERGPHDTVLSAVRFAHPVQRGFTLEGERVRLVAPEHRGTRTQDLPAVFHDAAQFYWFRVAALETQRSVWSSTTACLEVAELESQDIDTAEDWALAELKYRLWKTRNGQEPT